MSDVPAFPAPDPATRFGPHPTSEPGRASRRGWWFAIVLVVVTLASVAALFSEGTRRATEAAAEMVRISGGCRVPITLRQTGTYWVYVEEGPVPMPDIADCTNAGHGMTNPHGFPMFGFAVATVDGAEREVREVSSGRRYDLGPHSGVMTARFEGRQGETLVIGVVADSSGVALAIGEDVLSKRTPWRVASGVVLAVGLFLAVLAFRAAARR